jgi:hypothetical protein
MSKKKDYKSFFKVFSVGDTIYGFSKAVINLEEIRKRRFYMSRQENSPVEAIDPPTFEVAGISYGNSTISDFNRHKEREANIHDENRNIIEAVKTVNFGKDIEVMLINSTSLRILCYFLGLQRVNQLKAAGYSKSPLVTLLVMERIVAYMESKGFVLAGELAFDDEGNAIPVTKHAWNVGSKTVSFTCTGSLYFDKCTDNKNENVVFSLTTHLSNRLTNIACITDNDQKSVDFIDGLELYTRKNNCLRGKKLKDINITGATFEEVGDCSKYNWENFYYDDEVKTLFNREIFGFINNIEEYNKRGISKRGVMFYGCPGSGKTSLGKLICNYLPDNTVIWVTPDSIAENDDFRYSIKSLYALSDFLSPSVFILEDMDLIASDRESGGDNLRLGTLMNILDGVNSVHNSITVGMTNRMQSIEGALRNRPGRFDRLVQIDFLSDNLRKNMFVDRLGDFDFVDDNVLDYLVKNTSKWTGADTQEFINSLDMYFVENGKTGKGEREVTLDIVTDIVNMIKRFSLQEGKYREKVGFNAK